MTQQLDIDFTPPQPGEPQAAIELVCASGRYRKDFGKWLLANFPIWRAFEREATRLWMRGRKHYSARTIAEWIRHNTTLAEVESRWKLNNNVIPDLARLYADFYPDRADFFEFRHSDDSLARAA